MAALSLSQLKNADAASRRCQSPISLPQTFEFEVENKKVTFQADHMENIKRLGDGSFSSVVLVKDIKTGMHFAVKKFEKLDEESIQTVKSDMKIGKSVHSRFKINYFGAIQIFHSIWIVMEPMEMSIADFYTKLLINDATYYLPSNAIGYIAHCCVSGLEDLHSCKIIHRDVKPSNMLLDKSGNFKLCDFGISRIMKDSIAKSAVGTRGYFAPERINPKTEGDPYNIKSDIWSLGLSVMELAMMKFPFESCKSMMEQINAIVNQPPPRLPDLSPHIDDCYMIEFFDCTLTSTTDKRKRYEELKELQFIRKYDEERAFHEAKEVLSNLVIKICS